LFVELLANEFGGWNSKIKKSENQLKYVWITLLGRNVFVMSNLLCLRRRCKEWLRKLLALDKALGQRNAMHSTCFLVFRPRRTFVYEFTSVKCKIDMFWGVPVK